MSVPKCDGLVLTNCSNTARKNKSVNSFVPKPVHEGDLRLKWKTGLPDLRIAMELNETQFQKIIDSLRDLAGHVLDIDLCYEQQDHGKWNNFVAKACEGEPLWRKKYENAWPIATYMCRYLYNRAACSGNLTRSEDYKPPTSHSCARRPLRCGRRYKPYVRENTSPASTRSRTQSYRHDFKPAEQLVDPVQVVEKVVSPHVLSPTIFSHHAARVPFAPTSSNHAHDKGSPELLKSVTQRNKENATSQLPSQATTSSLDPSAPVKEFLCHLGEDLRVLLPVFVKKGIKDSATLSEFRKMKDEARAKFLASWKELDDFQHFRLVALNKQN